MSWEGLYVSLSRVREQNHLRLLLRNDDRNTLNYISSLKKDKYAKWFFKGYPNATKKEIVYWDKHGAIKAANNFR